MYMTLYNISAVIIVSHLGIEDESSQLWWKLHILC